MCIRDSLKVADARSDRLHKLTTRLAKAHHSVVVEDLAVAGMTKGAKGSGNWRGKAGLNRAFLNAAPGRLRRQLSYKCAWYGSKLVVADRWYPSSKTVSYTHLDVYKRQLPSSGGRRRHSYSWRSRPRRSS